VQLDISAKCKKNPKKIIIIIIIIINYYYIYDYKYNNCNNCNNGRIVMKWAIKKDIFFVKRRPRGDHVGCAT